MIRTLMAAADLRLRSGFPVALSKIRSLYMLEKSVSISDVPSIDIIRNYPVVSLTGVAKGHWSPPSQSSEDKTFSCNRESSF